MKDPIKWAMSITERSIDATENYSVAPAVIINWIFGMLTAVTAFLSLLSILLLIMVEIGPLETVRVAIVVTIAFMATWFASLKAIEIYLNFVDSRK